jgi:nucleoside-diphosphate-sugar epimerase
VGQEFNLASGQETRIGDLVGMVIKATGSKAGIRYVSRRKWDTKSRLLASVDRVGELIRYEPKTLFEEGLKSTVRWFWDNWEQIEAAARFGPGVSSAVREVAVGDQ